MTSPLRDRVREFARTWGTRGAAPRPLPPDVLRLVYGLWLAAFALKVLGATWDVSWHFRWLRDDLAPPHLLNTAGTVLVVLLVGYHSWTGHGVDRAALRLMQAGIGLFLLAVPIDLVNHRLNGLDITAWSVSHGLLYTGTALMLAGVVRGWARSGTGAARVPVLLALWALVLENVWFPAQQQEYGVLALAAWDRGAPDAEPILLQFAADQIGRPVDRAAVLHFALPVPDWVYPFWLVAAAGLVLVAARTSVGTPWAATTVAAAYVGFRCLAWPALVAGGFPPSAVPFALLGVGLAVDVAFRVRRALRPVAVPVLVAAGAGTALWAQQTWLVLPPVAAQGVLAGAAALAVAVLAAALRPAARAATPGEAPA
ncbi:MAG: hypothetical protein NTW05_17640 [Pseudonocardiales bacterium]|nr:hypothetical protein [Pseudonocardiales bacterium]